MRKPKRRREDHPTPEQIRTARERAGLTQTAAGQLIHHTLSCWQKYEQGVRRMPRACWELWQIKVAEVQS